MSTHPDINSFIALFERVKEITRGNPGQISIRARNDGDFKALCNELYIHHFFLRSKPDTIIPNVPGKFIEQWNLYERDYHPYIINVSVGHELLVAHGKVSDAPRAPEESEEVNYEYDLDDAREQSEAIWLRLALGPRKRRLKGKLTEELLEKLDIGEQALTDQIKSLGLDFEKMIFRGLRLRRVRVPTHSSKDATDPLSLVSFLQEAHRAFRLGLTLATIAICRSVSEVLLRDHYGIDPKSDAFTRRFELAKADPIASEKGADSELKALAQFGSEILHRRPDRAKKHLLEINTLESATLEDVALHWLKKLANLVEGVPEK